MTRRTRPPRSPGPLWLFAAVLFASSAAAAAANPQNPVKTQLLADTTHVAPGQTFTVGLLLHVEPQWHVYWTNPGDSGIPTSVKFKVPDGFTAGPVQYPVPVRFIQPGDVVGFGYHDSLLLTAKFTAPADLAGLREVKIGAAANWLACHEVCIPGRAKLELSLPVSAQGKPAHADVFGPGADRLPVDASAAPDIAKAQWSADAPGGEHTLNVEWKDGSAPKDIDLFPHPSHVLEVGRPLVKTEGTTTRLTVKVRLFPGEKLEADALPALLAYTDKEGKRRGVNTAIPLSP